MLADGEAHVKLHFLSVSHSPGVCGRQIEAILKRGRAKRTRWLNDILLRDMAGHLTARAMEGLFKPVPFGETRHVTALSEAVTMEDQALWDAFRSIDMDRESRVLEVRPCSACSHSQYTQLFEEARLN